MALRIRLRRMGRKKAPHFRIVVAENTMPRDGRFVDILGHYNPRTDPMTIVVDDEKARSWLEKGATPTDTVRSLLKRAGVIGNRQIPAEGAEAPAAAPAAEAPSEEAPAPAKEEQTKEAKAEKAPAEAAQAEAPAEEEEAEKDEEAEAEKAGA